MKPHLLLVLTAVTFLYGARCVAEDSREEAVQLFNEGVALFNDGDFGRAADKFRQANKIMFNWKLLYNIAQSEAAAKRHGLALQAFEEYLARGGDDVPIARREEVVAEVKNLREMVGYIQLEGPDGAVVFVDDMERDKLPLSGPIIVAAGVSHDVQLILNNETVLSRSVRVTGQQTFTLKCDDDNDHTENTAAATEEPPPSTDASEVQETKPAPEPQPAAASSAGAQKLRIAGMIGLAVGGAALVAGGITGGLALSKGKKLEEDYGDSVPYREKDTFDRMTHLATASTALIIGGGVLAATGAVLLVVSAKKKEQLAFSGPALAPGFAGIVAGGRF